MDLLRDLTRAPFGALRTLSRTASLVARRSNRSRPRSARSACWFFRFTPKLFFRPIFNLDRFAISFQRRLAPQTSSKRLSSTASLHLRPGFALRDLARFFAKARESFFLFFLFFFVFLVSSKRRKLRQDRPRFAAELLKSPVFFAKDAICEPLPPPPFPASNPTDFRQTGSNRLSLRPEP